GGLYAANIFAKNAGYDLPKKLGLQDMDAEVKGTPLSKFYTLDPENMNKVKASTVASMAFVNLKELHDKYVETNDPSIHFMDPARFPDQFPEFKGMSPSCLKKTDLSHKEDDYKKAGQELYFFVKGIENSYDKTLYKETNVPFATALKDNTLKASTVFALAMALSPFAADGESKNVLLRDDKAYSEMDTRIGNVLKDKKLSYSLEVTPDKNRGFNGFIMSYPVVIRVEESSKSYLVFAKSDYEGKGGNLHERKALARIPFEGEASGRVDELKKGITARMKDMVAIFADTNKNSVVDITNMDYHEDGNWYATLNYKESNISSASTGPTQVIITTSNGKDVQVRLNDKYKRILLQVNDVTDTASIPRDGVMAQLSIQPLSANGPDLTSLGWFYRNKRLQIVDENPNDEFFDLKIGSISETQRMKYDKQNKTYFFVNDEGNRDTNAEKEIVKNSAYRRDVAEIIIKDPDFNKPIDSFKKLLDNAPAEYLGHFAKNFSTIFKDATWAEPFRGMRLENFTGSISKNYVLGLIDAQKGFVASKLQHRLEGVKDISEASKQIELISGAAFTQFDKLNDNFARMNGNMKTEGKDWSKIEFTVDVISELSSVGIESQNYKEWRQAFILKTFHAFGNDALRGSEAYQASDVVKVFDYYTSAVDDSKVDEQYKDKSGETAEAEKTKSSLLASSKSADAELVKALAEVDELEKSQTQSLSSGIPFIEADLALAYNKLSLARKNADNSKQKLKEAEKKLYDLKNDEYTLAVGYVNYVDFKINTRLQTIRGSAIPSPGPDWEIPSYADYKKNPTDYVPKQIIFVDTREPLK
ncbi:MAG: hypothetical protein PHP74_03345, partial [Candidatus Gracilibacteria bacterium]|nr:hypothetical protein [Candidatus Gracilibacteria bacterium]